MKIFTYNIHKGFSPLNRKLIVHHIRDGIEFLQPDLVFLQEVVGESRHRKKHRHPLPPPRNQHEYLAATSWQHVRYGQTRMSRHGHHGNAILSKLPIVRFEEVDLTTVPFEKRAMLHCEISMEGRPGIHCLCVHLSLLKKGRHKQYLLIRKFVEKRIPADAPLILAGDFNDWSKQACRQLSHPLNLQEVFSQKIRGGCANSFPARIPFLRLDRIYVRGFHFTNPTVHGSRYWARLSDHAPLSVDLALKPIE